jgi:hypothetical protein
MPQVSIEPVVIKPKWPTLSRAARRLIVVSVPWFFGALVGADALGLAGTDDPQAQRWLALLVAIAPVAALVFHPWLGHVHGLRWLHHRTQPRLAIRADGLHLRLPDVGERLYGWDVVGGLRMRPDHTADLIDVDGVSLVRIPDSMTMAGGTYWRSESIASAIVRAQPHRYRLSGANWAGEPNEFALRDATEPNTSADSWATRRRVTTVAIWLAFVVVTLFLLVRFLSS